MIVVTGATGNVGRPLVQALAEAGEAVTAVSRHAPDPGLRHGRADLADPGSLKPALDGADALFLLTLGGRPGEIIDVARAAGVRRVVLLSSLGAGTRPDRYQPFVMFETAVRGSGLDWTILRPGGFASNTFCGPSRSGPGGPSWRRSGMSACRTSTRPTSPRSPPRRCAAARPGRRSS